MAKIVKCKDFEWEGITPRRYKEDRSCFKGVHRYSILGESADEQQLNFQTRYFEVDAGGYTTLEYHRHPHTVIIIRGSGTVVLDSQLHDLSLHDVIYITPETLHQFHADKGEKLGFLCIVDRYRDRPMLPDEQFLDDMKLDESVRKKIKI